VVVVVFDQLGSWVLEHHQPFLSPDGAIARAQREGFYAKRAQFSYGGTVTAAGHSAISTGANPYQNGIPANRRFDRTRNRVVSMVDDGEHALVNNPKRFASPELLRVEGVGDVLKEATQGAGKILSVSIKDRGAVLMAGRRPDLALWFDRDVKGFTTSTYYARRLPAWVDSWNAAHPVSALMTPWDALQPEAYAAVLGPDDAPGESDWAGFGKVFPHEAGRSTDPLNLFLLTPQSSEWLFSLAAEGAAQMHLGEDDTPDLLMISVSGTDLVGHTFGAESWESVDHLVRADLALGRLVKDLEAKHGPVAVLMTADHGVTPLPERSTKTGAGRVSIASLTQTANSALEAALGPGKWVVAYQHPFMTLSLEARRGPASGAAIDAAREALRTLPGVFDVVKLSEGAALRAGENATLATAARSIPPGFDADFLVIPKENTLVGDDEGEGHGTTHGSPWTYDTQVPVLAFGAGVPRREETDTVSQRRIAATISYLLGQRPPAYAEKPHLFSAPTSAR
jgi:hypothetical protein